MYTGRRLILGVISAMSMTFFAFVGTPHQVFAGITSLTGTTCDDTVSVTWYDIDFGTFISSDVFSTYKTNAGTKVGTTATPSNGGSDVYIIATNTCQSDTSWSVRIMADYMTSAIAGTPHISNTGQFFEGANTIYLFSGTIANDTIVAGNYTSTTDLSDWRSIMTKTDINNGLAGYYGRLFTHSIRIEQGQPVGYYSGTFFVNCNSC